MGLPARKRDQRYTYADYKTWIDDERWELINGEAWNMSSGRIGEQQACLRPAPAPSRKHQWLVMELGRHLSNLLLGKRCQIYPAPFDVFFPENSNQLEDEIHTIVQPDLTVVCDHKKLNDKGCFGAPDLVVEILSPYTSRRDLDDKFHLYENSGVKEYWVVDPGSRSIHFFSLNEDNKYGDGEVFVEKGELKSTVLDGFSIDLSEIFSGMDVQIIPDEV